MPGFFYEPIGRKTFFKASGMLTATALMSRAFGANQKTDESNQTRIALLSDTHIPADVNEVYRGFRPAENLRVVVEQVAESAPTAALINGDAARLAGSEADYHELKSLLQPLAHKTPIHIGLGNHDDRRNFFKIFPAKKKSTVNGKHVSVFDAAGTRFIILDSLLYVNKTAGLLGKATRSWLKTYLDQASRKPTLFFVHHTLGDEDSHLLDFDRFFEIVRPHRHVKAIFYGHSHRYHVDQKDHIYLINQPALGYNFNDNEPVGWLDATFSPQGVDLTLRAIAGNKKGNGEKKVIAWA
jgi:3',5'-cyclic AMP phosphodiesterase CpdA